MDARFHPYDQRKRTRQACEPCRRKKAKCTGERPGCATCARLRQRCFYAAELPPGPVARAITSDPSDAAQSRETHSGSAETDALSARVQSLESTLAQVLANLRQSAPAGQDVPAQQPVSRPPSSQSSRDAHEDVAIPLAAPLRTPSHLAAADLLPPWPTVLAAGRDYLRYCDSQPIPLFHPDSFIESLADRDPEVLYGVLALARRFSRGSSSAQQQEPQEPECAAYVQAARRIAMTRVVEGRVELSTIQTLCLLAHVAFYNGAIDQSRVHISLASSLAHCARLHREVNRQDSQPAAEERRRCYWGLVLLQRLAGWPADDWNDGCSSDNSSSWDRDGQLPLFPASPLSPPSEADGLGAVNAPTEAQRVDGILGTVIQLAEVWSLAQDYVRTRGASAAPVMPWSPQSQYTRALRRLMDLGRDLPPLHRNRCIRLANVSAEDLRDSRARAYWAPWFLSHFLYHTAICLLNHPLLMTLQFQDGHGFSEVFLQQTTHLAAYHSSWLLHFVDFFNRRQFAVTDPLFGYCVAVVATIELQHSFSNDHALRQKARANYDHCLEFLRTLGGGRGSGGNGSSPWPCIGRLVQKLDALADQMKAYHHQGGSTTAGTAGTAADDDSNDSNIHINDATLIVNISGFLELLDLAASVRVPSCAPLFGGATLPLHPAATEEEAAAALGPTPLSRLPGITALDPAKATGRGERDANGNAAIGSRPEPPSPQPSQQQQQLQQPQPPQQPQQQRGFSLDGGSDVFLPVDQLLGGHLQDANAWWTGTWGDSAGSWASGAPGRTAWPLDESESYSF